MIKSKDTLMAKMCVCKSDCIGVEVDGVFYLYENFDDETVSRIYKDFGTNHSFTFYSQQWAHQARIKEAMEYRNALFIAASAVKLEKITKDIVSCIVKWSGCTEAEALEQVQSCKVNYSKIR